MSMINAQNSPSIRPIYDELKLYYRHAEEENLFLLGPETNSHKADWLKRQINALSGLGWKFLILDMSQRNVMGRTDILGGEWSNIERNAILKFVPPVYIRIPTFRALLDTLDEVNIIKLNYPQTKHITMVYLGETRALAPEEKDALYGALLKLSTYQHGIWLAAERFQAFPLDKLDLFQTQIVFADEDDTDIEFPKWAKQYNLADLNEGELDEEEAYCLLRGKTSGPGRLLISNLSDWRNL